MLSRNQIPSTLKPTLEDTWTDEMSGKRVWESCGFKVENTKDAYVDDQEFAYFGPMEVKEEGAAAAADDIQEGYPTRYNVVTYAKRGVVSEEAIADCKYKDAINMSKALAISAKLTQEFEGANVFIRAFNSAFVGGDGDELCSTSHPLPKGGTYSNMFSTAMSLSELAIETMSVNMAKLPSSNGYITNGVMLEKIVIPEELKFRAMRILKSEKQNDTANNAINPLKGMGIAIAPNRYLTSATNWFGISDVAVGLKWIWRHKPEFRDHNDDTTYSKHFSGYMRFVCGWTNPRAVYGSNI